MANVSNSGNHKGTRQENFWKRKEFLANEVDSFKQNNPTLFGAPIDMPEFDAPQEQPITEQPSTDGSFNFSSSYETSKPVSITDIVLQKASAGEKPQYDERQKARLQKQARFAALAQGIQGLAGAIGMSAGLDVPTVDNSQLGASAINRLNDLDERYFQEMAQYRDAELRANFYNTQAANDAEMAEWRARQERIAEKGQMDFRSGEAEKDRKFRAGESAKDRELRKRGFSIDQQRINNYSSAQKLEAIKRYETEYDDLYKEYADAMKNFDDAKAAELLPQMQENMRIRRELQRQLAEREGFEFPSNETPQPQSDIPNNMGDALREYPGAKQPQPTKSQQPKQKDTGKSAEIQQAYNSMVNDAVTKGFLTSGQLEVLLRVEGIDPERTLRILQSKGVKLPEVLPPNYPNTNNPLENSQNNPQRELGNRW